MIQKDPIHIVRVIARLNVGGPAKHVLWLFDLDNSNNFRTTLITGHVENNEEEINIDKKLLSKIIYLENLKRSIGLFNELNAFLQILILFLKLKPNIIDTHTSKAGFHGRLAAFCYNIYLFLTFRKPVKVIHTFHGHTFSGYFSKPITLLFLVIERILARFMTNTIIVISKNQFEDICNKFKIASVNKFLTLDLGIDIKPFSQENLKSHRGNLRKELNITQNIKTVVIVSRIAPIKNHTLFIKAAKSYIDNFNSNIRFLIIGSGATEELIKLNKLVNYLSLEPYVYFMGTRFDLVNIYADTDIMLLTSINEGTPFSILEAMACKIPCIASNVGGIPDLLGSNRGILIDSAEPEDFAKAIDNLLNNKTLIDNLTNNACEYVKKQHNKETLLENIQQLYKSGFQYE